MPDENHSSRNDLGIKQRILTVFQPCQNTRAAQYVAARVLRLSIQRENMSVLIVR